MLDSLGGEVTYIAVDGDDIGRQITKLFLTNDTAGLSSFADLVQDKVRRITLLLESRGYRIIFSAADGVVAHADAPLAVDSMYQDIADMGGSKLTFSVGVGDTLRDAYVALLAAKSSGKARLSVYGEI